MAFTAAFSLETLVYSHQTWTKLSTAGALAMMIFLICWCIWTTVEAGIDFSALGSVHRLKDKLVKFTKGLRGNVSEPRPDAGDGEDEDSQGKSGKFYRSGSFKQVFNFARRRRGVSTSSTLVGNWSGRPSDTTGVELGKINGRVSGTAAQDVQV